MPMQYPLKRSARESHAFHTLILMKKVCTLFALFVLSVTTQAVNYYFSSILGNDSRSAIQAKNPATPWKTINKVNSYFSHFLPGDSILFRRGDTFYGSLTIKKSGTAGLPIVFSCYGDPALNIPQITGMIALGSWSNKGNGIWESNCSGGSSVNVVLLNGAFQVLGRYPNSNATNKGYLNFESHSGSGSITDNQLSASPNWTGAELVIRPNRWVVDRDSILLHSGTNIQFNSATGYTPIDNFGYFIQKSINTLDQTGEWFYNTATKKMDVFFGTSNPQYSTVQASILNNLITLNGENNISFVNLALTGSNKDAISISSAQNITISNCTILYSGANALSGTNTQGLRIQSNRISETNNTALSLSNSCSGSFILNNVITNTGIHAGMGQSGNDTYEGIWISGDNNTIENNTIDSTGYIGIDFSGNNTLIKNNVISHFTQTKDDGGGIYTWTGASNLNPSSNRVISGNLVLYGTGAGEGTDEPLYLPSEGIYMDDNTGNVTISGNTVAGCGNNGIYLHNAHNITVRQNTLYNNTKQLDMGHDGNCPNCLVVNNSLMDNILVSAQTTQPVFGLESISNDLSDFGAFDSNYYCRPFDDNQTINNTYVASGSQVNVSEDLAMWQAAYQKDPHSKKSPLDFSPYTINGYIGSNMYPNGSFASNVDGQYVYSAQNNVYAAWDNTGKLDGGALRFYFTPSSGLVNISKTIIGIGAVTAGQNYIVKFSLLGTKNNKTMNVFFRQSLSPYNTISPVSVCKISSTRTEQQFLISPTVSESNASLIYEIGEQDSTLWLDNIQLYAASISMNIPAGDILFEYNPTSSPLSVSLSGSYMDVKSTSYSGSVVLAPYSSIVLLNKAGHRSVPFANLPGSPPLESLQLTIYPNPVTDMLTVSGSEDTENRVEVFDLTGKVILTKMIHPAPGEHLFQIDLSELAPAIYLLKVSTLESSSQKMFVKTK